MAVPDAHLLFAVGRADARIHVEHDASGRTAGMNLSIHWPERSASADRFFSAVSHRVSKRPIWLADAAHPKAAFPPTIQRIAGSWRSRSASLTSSYPASRPNDRLPQHADQRMPAVLAGAGVGEPLARHCAQAERVVEFSISEQTCIRRHNRTAKLERQSPVEI